MEHPWLRWLMFREVPFVPMHRAAARRLLSTAPLILKPVPDGNLTRFATGQKSVIREGGHFTFVGRPQGLLTARNCQLEATCSLPSRRLANRIPVKDSVCIYLHVCTGCEAVSEGGPHSKV